MNPYDVLEYRREFRLVNHADPATLHSKRCAATLRWELDFSEALPVIRSVPPSKVSRASVDFTEHTDWVAELVAATRIVNVDDRAMQILGISLDLSEVIGEAVGRFVPPDVRQILAELIVDVATEASRARTIVRRLESNERLKDPVVTAWRSEARHSSNTVFISVTGLADDDRSLWDLRASEERYQTLIQRLPIALLQVDVGETSRVLRELKKSGVSDLDAYLQHHPEVIDSANTWARVTEINERAISLLGGTSAVDFLGPAGFLFAEARDVQRRVLAARFNLQRNHTEIMKIRTASGQLRDVQLSVAYPTPSEKLDVTLLALEDITERLSTERQLHQLEADFERSARIALLGQVTATIAHEVNQPLTSIVTNAETSLRWLARQDPNLEKVKQLTARIASSGRAASDIVQRIRGMAAKQEAERIPLCLDEVVEEALVLVGHEIDSKSIVSSIQLAATLPVIGDRIALQQVVVNLLCNSIQAVTESGVVKGQIKISTRVEAGDKVSFSIHDNGPGIAVENLDRIFEGFFSTKPTGMGIGLAISHSIVAAHNGTISVLNHPEGGACFTFTLPAAAP
ncbi:PAS domain-containing sensor histidine kinase [Sinorhizobium mexicanum]|nr:ATP-binding protein [Sinorhizobium mexicanum]MBP1884268.1 C4-dicarboxylate-specific signal transduction histidine kinase [Sinorhizobium mexicanum]